MQIKTTGSHHLTPARMAVIIIIDKSTHNKDVEKGGPQRAAEGDADWGSCCGKQYGVSSKN